MMNNIHIAVDLAKNVFQIAECNASDKIISRKRLNRTQFQCYLAEPRENAIIIMEACGTAHHWGRIAQAAGHRVALLHAHYVKPYRRRNKTDRNDSEAILNAFRAEGLTPVPVKTVAQQQIQQLHCLREMWKSNRNQRINLLRGILREHGFDNAAKTDDFLRQCNEAIDSAELKALAPQMHIVLAEIQHLSEWMATCEQQLHQLLQQDEIIDRIDAVSGVGLLTASAFVAAIGAPERFKSGRMVSAWLGMTPQRIQQWQSAKTRGNQSRRQCVRANAIDSRCEIGPAGGKTLRGANAGEINALAAMGNSSLRSHRL